MLELLKYLNNCHNLESFNHTHEHVSFSKHVPATVKVHPFGGYQYIFQWPNGVGASVICNYMSYYYYEIAILFEGAITYNTVIADDVIGGLDLKEVIEVLDQIDTLYGNMNKEELSKIMYNVKNK